MRTVLLGLLAILAWPARGSANRVTDVTFTLSDSAAVITVTAARPLAQPRVRSSRGSLKVWFPDVHEDTRLDLSGDGAAIGQIRLRPGAADTALLQVTVLNDALLTKDALSAEAQGPRFFLRIARSALPQLEQDGEDVPVTTATARMDQVAAAGEVAGQTPLPLAGRKERPAPPLSTMATAKAPLDSASRPSGTVLWVMLLLVVALLAGVGLVRKLKLRALSEDHWPDIHVLGSRRLGPRHQLVLVRALGEDHLLIMNGDRTERIASLPAPRQVLPAEVGPPRELPPAQGAEAGHGAHSYAELLSAVAGTHDQVSLSTAAPAARPSPPFGSELLNVMQRHRPVADQPGAIGFLKADAAASPSIQGLLRLRREVG